MSGSARATERTSGLSGSAPPRQAGGARSALWSLPGDVYGEMTALARASGAVNLGQAMPDFDGPAVLRTAAAGAMAAGRNQYGPSAGEPELRRAVAERPALAGRYDPEREVTITAGATEALAAAMLALLDPGDEVLLIEPFYDSYPAMVALAGAIAVPVAMERVPPAGAGLSWRLPVDALAAAAGPRTRMIVVNTPHNPTGRVLGPAELGALADLARRHDLYVLTDEVYEELWFDAPHVSPAAVDGLRERTVVCGSVSKSLSVCGWRVGWALAPAELTAAIRVVHRFLSFCAPPPLQLAVAEALRARAAGGYFDTLRETYRRRRDLLAGALVAAGLPAAPAQGSTFLVADTSGWWDGEPLAVARELVRAAGVAGLPLTSFCARGENARGVLRFAFCKDLETLAEAGRRLRSAAPAVAAVPLGGDR